MANINTKLIVKYNPILVKDNWKLPNKSAFTLNRFLIVNWSNGLAVHKGNELNINMYISNIITLNYYL